MTDRIQAMAEYLFKTMREGTEYQRKGLQERWPDAEFEEIESAYAVYRKLDWDNQEKGLVELTKRYQELKAQGIEFSSMDELWEDYWKMRSADPAVPKEREN